MRIVRVILGVLGTLAAGGTLLAAELQVKVRNYELDAAFFPERAQMEATARIGFEPIPETVTKLAFFLHGELSVESVTATTDELEYTEEKVLYFNDYSLVANRVEVERGGWSGNDALVVRYSGYFHPSKVRSPSDYMRIDADAVLLRSYGYSLWFPIFLPDDEDSYDVSFSRVTLRTPREFRSVFVGEKRREYLEDSQWLTEWTAKEVDLFDAQLTAQRYRVMGKRGYFIYHLEDHTSRDKAEGILSFAERLNQFYSDNYDADAETAQVHIMQMPRYGDISSGNVVGINTEAWQAFDPNSSPARLLAHELVHGFVQPRIARSNPMYALAIEGFPSYFHLPALAHILGETYYQDYLQSIEEQYLKKKEAGTDQRGRKLPPEKPILGITADEIGIYKDRFVLSDRVLLFFDYLRSRMGSKSFLELTREMFNNDRLDSESFQETILRFIPDAAEELQVWLTTTDYPARWRLPNR